MKKHEIYTKNGNDFAIHEIKDGQVFGVVYPSKFRGRLNETNTPYSLRRIAVDKFLAERPSLVRECLRK